MKVHRLTVITALYKAISESCWPPQRREWEEIVTALGRGEALEFYPDDVPVVLGDSKGIPLNN